MCAPHVNQRSSFAKEKNTIKRNQKCEASGCKTCEEIGLPQKIKINNVEIKLDFSKNCKTGNVVYVYICKHCNGNTGYYFGQTTENMHKRANGHRTCFSTANEKYKNSALSYHIFEEHKDKFDDKLTNYRLGIINSAIPMNLDRVEEFFIYNTKADLLCVNRYKALLR